MTLGWWLVLAATVAGGVWVQWHVLNSPAGTTHAPVSLPTECGVAAAVLLPGAAAWFLGVRALPVGPYPQWVGAAVMVAAITGPVGVAVWRVLWPHPTTR